MKKLYAAPAVIMVGVVAPYFFVSFGYPQTASRIGRKVAFPMHMQDGQEYQVSLSKLLSYGEKLFSAKWTSQEGEGRPMAKLTRADITAVTLYQATLPIPGQVIPSDSQIRQAIRQGAWQFRRIGCANCHVPALPLVRRGWIYTEPNPYNPSGDLQDGEAPSISVDLTSVALPSPRLKPAADGMVWVPAFTDLKLHDITNGPDDPNAEPLDQNQPAGSEAFFAGNRKFITRKLWGVGNSGPYMHNGEYTTMREAILAHGGEALQSREAFQHLSDYGRDCVIEFLKSLQILPPGSRSLAVDGDGKPVTPIM